MLVLNAPNPGDDHRYLINKIDQALCGIVLNMISMQPGHFFVCACFKTQPQNARSILFLRYLWPLLSPHLVYLVRQAPALVVLSEHVDEGVDVQASLLRAHAEHHTEKVFEWVDQQLNN